MKIKVIGAGFAGLWTSLFLLKKGYNVELYEQSYPGYGASSKAAGILSFQIPLQIMDYAIRSAKLYEELNHNLLKWKESIWIPKKEEFSCALKISDYLLKKGFKGKIVEKEFNSFKISEKAIIIEQAVIDSGMAVNELANKIVELGGNIIGSRFTKDKIIDEKNNVLVLANGSWIKELIYINGLINYKCQAYDVEGKQIDNIIEDDIKEYYYVPESNNRAIIGNGKRVLLKKPEDGYISNIYDAYRILEKISSNYNNALDMYPVSSWSAPCITSNDGFPLVGKINENKYIITALNGAGLTLSASLAELLADIIEGKKEQPLIFNPLRFKDNNHYEIKEVFENIC
ncbi:MAG: FAD-dependent oxidoreductase [Caldisphaera sp.]|jgi:glycine/D-amino acid oxidase-like deaminating enzyme|nr:FAD-binding oxidoreductase [Caldisphaera sp.]PMP61243.1 MAG: hypothetical protein C0201_00140 [Caldisphaera sp.]PMP89468.1 MAG: hypothetical protein C0171_07050 [Caldisphaera sp.]